MKLDIKKGSTSQSVAIFIQDATSAVGGGLTGLVFNSGSLAAYYYRPGGSATVHTLQTLSTITSAWASGGFKEIDSANMPGWYRLDVFDAVFATGVNRAYVSLKGATNMMPVNLEFQLVDYDPYDAVRLGLTALPNAVAGAANSVNDVLRFGGTAVSLVGGVPSVNTLTQDNAVRDGTRDAVWSKVLDTFNTAASALTTTATAQQIMSLLLAEAAGRASNGGNTFSTPDNTSVRINATASGGNRTVITLTPST